LVQWGDRKRSGRARAVDGVGILSSLGFARDFGTRLRRRASASTSTPYEGSRATLLTQDDGTTAVAKAGIDLLFRRAGFGACALAFRLADRKLTGPAEEIDLVRRVVVLESVRLQGLLALLGRQLA